MDLIRDYCLEINVMIIGLQKIELIRPDLFNKYIVVLWEERQRIMSCF